MLTFIQTKLFTRLFSERYSDDDLAELERHLAAIRKPVTWWWAQAVSEKCAGVRPGAVNVAVYASFIS